MLVEAVPVVAVFVVGVLLVPDVLLDEELVRLLRADSAESPAPTA